MEKLKVEDSVSMKFFGFHLYLLSVMVLLCVVSCDVNDAIFSGIYGRNDYAVVLIRKRDLTDFTISVNDTLHLNLTEYYVCRHEESGMFEQYPRIVAEVSDSTILTICYDYEIDPHGQNFAVVGLTEGVVNVILHLLWQNDLMESSDSDTFRVIVE